MLNIQIYIDTCEDQTPSTSVSVEAERPDRHSKNDAKKRHFQRVSTSWFTSSEENYVQKIELSDGR